MLSSNNKDAAVITGAGGFLGRHVLACLVASGRKVLALSRQRQEGMTMIESYALAPASGFLVHLAEEPDRGKVNQWGSAYVAESNRTIRTLAERFGKNLLYASSGTVYGDKSDRPHGVASSTDATDFYTRSKLMNEAAVVDAGGIVVRLSNLYGPGMSSNNVMSDIVRQIPGNGPIKVRDASPIRDFLHVTDAALAIGLLLQSGFSGIVNVGSGVGMTIESLARLALEVAGEDGREVQSTSPAPLHSANILDISETRRIIDWEPAISLREYFANLFQASTKVVS